MNVKFLAEINAIKQLKDDLEVHLLSFDKLNNLFNEGGNFELNLTCSDQRLNHVYPMDLRYEFLPINPDDFMINYRKHLVKKIAEFKKQLDSYEIIKK